MPSMPPLDLLLASADRTAPPGAEAATSRPSDALLCEQAPRLRRLVHRLLGWRTSGHELDDVVQDVLLAALRHRDGFRGEASVATWLTRIALSKASEHGRRAALRRRLFSPFARDGAHPDAATPAGAGPDDRLDRTRRAMQRLGHRDREVLVLRYLEQKDVPAMAALLGCARPAIDARLSRARQRLRQLLDAEEDA